MPKSSSEVPALPNEVWLDILHLLSLDTLWFTTRPVCTVFYHISTAIAKAALINRSSCELRHYISYRDPLLSESLECPSRYTNYQRRILEQEGHSPFSQILLWSSVTISPADPQDGPGIPTVAYESADGKKFVTMAVFRDDPDQRFHCRRQGCMISDEDNVSDGQVCLAGCWHVHFSRAERIFTATIPLAMLFPIYLRLASSKSARMSERALELALKGYTIRGSRHGASASVSPVRMNDPVENERGGLFMDVDDGIPGNWMDWEEDEDGYLNGLFED